MTEHTPERFLAGPLRWTHTGSVLATWVITTPLPIPMTTAEAVAQHEASRSLWEAFPGRRYWLESMVCWTSPSALAEKMLAQGRDQIPRWLTAVDEAIDFFAPQWLGDRRYLLTVELPSGLQGSLARAGRAAGNTLLGAIGASPLAPSVADYQAAIEKMEAITQRIPDVFGAVPATPEIIAWSRRHHIRREGEDLADLMSDSDLQLFDRLEGAGQLEWCGLDQSSISTLSQKDRPAAPWRNQWVAVTDEDGHTNYQAHLLLRRMPRQLPWPDMEFLGRIDDAAVQVDYTICGVARPRIEAMTLNSKAMNKLNNQVDQVGEADAGSQDIHMARLQAAAQVLSGYNSDFVHDEHLVEHEPVVILSFSHDDPAELRKQVAAFKKETPTLSWASPVGAEQAAFLARMPGGVLPKELDTYHQVSHSQSMATTGALTAARLGHDTGLPLWTNHMSGVRRLVHWEPFGESDTHKQVAAAMATRGVMGSGKTYFAMTVAGQMVDAGARLIATDTTKEKEWSAYAKSLDTSVAEVAFDDPRFSVDPLRCLPVHEAAEVSRALLSTLLNLDSDAPERFALNEVLTQSFLAEHHVDSLPALLDAVPRARREAAASLGDRLELWMDKDRFPALFDLSLPPIDTHAQCLIWNTCNVELPSQEEIEREHLFRKMSDSKRIGRAVYSMFTWYAKGILGRDQFEPVLMNIDEAHAVFASPEAVQGQLQIVRMLRHNLGAVHYQTQLGEFPPALLALIGTRLLLKPDPDDLDSAIDFIAASNATEETRERLKAMVMEHCMRGRGAGILRLQKGADVQIGKVQTNKSFTTARQAAAGTSSARAATRS